MQRRVLIVVFPGFQLLDMAGPADVFATADLLVPEGGYRVEVAAVGGGAVPAGNGVTVTASALGEVAGPIDTLLVAGGLSVPERLADRQLVGHIAGLAAGARRVASVCNGAFLLAEAGLLDHRRVTTHWLAARDLDARYERVEVDADPLYIEDGDIWTSAGVLSGVDLALALVARDHGHALARDVARGLVVYLHRPGGQSQFSTPMRSMTPRSEPLRELQAHIDESPTPPVPPSPAPGTAPTTAPPGARPVTSTSTTWCRWPRHGVQGPGPGPRPSGNPSPTTWAARSCGR
ncbi:AraC family transcriptional regulator [Nonomuraea sp. NPDC049784]|uniref:GlxA family transcriptional regulator n=1 Tax=Nonomuraea sp. NPDC049784 TaxID=3154361 RepID=UPI0033DED345